MTASEESVKIAEVLTAGKDITAHIRTCWENPLES